MEVTINIAQSIMVILGIVSLSTCFWSLSFLDNDEEEDEEKMKFGYAMYYFGYSFVCGMAFMILSICLFD